MFAGQHLAHQDAEDHHQDPQLNQGVDVLTIQHGTKAHQIWEEKLRRYKNIIWIADWNSVLSTITSMVRQKKVTVQTPPSYGGYRGGNSAHTITILRVHKMATVQTPSPYWPENTKDGNSAHTITILNWEHKWWQHYTRHHHTEEATDGNSAHITTILRAQVIATVHISPSPYKEYSNLCAGESMLLNDMEEVLLSILMVKLNIQCCQRLVKGVVRSSASPAIFII